MLCVGCAPTAAPDDTIKSLTGNPLLDQSLLFLHQGGYIAAEDTANTRAIVWLENEVYDVIGAKEYGVIMHHRTRVTFHPITPYSEPIADIKVNDSTLLSSNFERTKIAYGANMIQSREVRVVE